MFMPHDRRQAPTRSSHVTPMADATGSPFTVRTGSDGARPATTDPRDYREQADGAP
ncbi:MAG: hypothetical protein ACK6DP_11335 [Gemmatimonas sp.]|jgi:hypothetical protein|uniref:hypothetical protein n=1 Tax=Gemmatimonas sp. TaxID=1962908 RepID=UPI00391F975C